VAPGTCPVLVKQGLGRGDRKTLLSHFALLHPLGEESKLAPALLRISFGGTALAAGKDAAVMPTYRINPSKNQPTY
jgi:hypothetical protein